MVFIQIYIEAKKSQLAILQWRIPFFIDSIGHVAFGIIRRKMVGETTAFRVRNIRSTSMMHRNSVLGSMQISFTCIAGQRIIDNSCFLVLHSPAEILLLASFVSHTNHQHPLHALKPPGLSHPIECVNDKFDDVYRRISIQLITHSTCICLRSRSLTPK